MATNNVSTERNEPSKAELLLMLAEVVKFSEQYKVKKSTTSRRKSIF